MSMIFRYPAVLFLCIPILPALLFIRFRFNRLLPLLSSLLRSGTGSTVRSQLRAQVLLRAVLWSVAWLALVTALAGPRWGTRTVALQTRSTNVIMVFDISRSMIVDDLKPTRLDFAARYAVMLMEHLQGVPVGVVLARGDGVLAVPVTEDRRTVLTLVESLSPLLLSGTGSNIAEGIRTAMNSFPSTRGTSGTIIVFSDGDQTSGSLRDAAVEAGNAGCSLIFVGVGTLSGSEIDIYPGESASPVVQTVLAETELMAAARLAGRNGLYVQALEPSSARKVLQQIVPSNDATHQTTYTDSPVLRYREFLLLALVFFAAGLVSGGLAWKRK